MTAKRLSGFFLIAVLLAGLSGCIFLVAGTIGAVGGYAVSRDTIQGEYDASYADTWKAATEVCSLQGTVLAKDKTNGVIDATVDGANVRVEIAILTKEATRVKVKARKGIFPRLGTAEKVFTKIVQQLM